MLRKYSNADPVFWGWKLVGHYRWQIQHSVYDSVRGGSADVSSTSVEIVTRDGRRYEHRSTGVPGDPKNPVDWEQIEAKFRDCVSFSAKPVSPGNVDKAAELIRHLDDLADVNTLIRLLG